MNCFFGNGKTMFLVLSDTLSDRKFRVNVDKIIAYISFEEGSKIYFENSNLTVKEKPEELDKMIREDWILPPTPIFSTLEDIKGEE